MAKVCNQGIDHGVLYILEISAKGGLISGSFSLWLKSPKMVAKSQPLASFLWVDSAQGGNLAQFFGDLSQKTSFKILYIFALSV